MFHFLAKMRLSKIRLSCQDEIEQDSSSSDVSQNAKVFGEDYVSLEIATLVAENPGLSSLVSDEPTLRARMKKEKPKKIRKSKTIDDSKGRPAFYIFDYEGDTGGFSIVSADKREAPLLAYSDNGDFDVDNLEELPPSLMSWLSMMEDEISAIREDISAVSVNSEDAALEWNDMELSAIALQQSDPNSRTSIICPQGARCDDPGNPTPPPPITVGPFLQTTWSQGCGYNDNTPATSNAGYCYNAPTGCVATAMAQIMRFHQYPSRYNWALMPNSVNSQGASSKLARLMKDAGVSVGMNYGSNSSGTQTDKVDDALRSTFSYSSASWIDNSYSQETIKSNLNSRRPVILRGKSEKNCFLGIFCDYDGGHAWVCDGYRTYNTECCGYLYFHMNWGWGGSYDGWFGFNNWNLSSYAFNYKRAAVVNIKP